MKVKPVLRAVKPAYPDKYQIEYNKTLLQYRPKSWLKKPLAGLALTALLSAGLSGCYIGGWGETSGEPSPPNIYHVSDADALRILSEEFEKAGFIFVEGNASESADFEFDAHIIKDESTVDVEYVSIDDVWDGKYFGVTTGYFSPKLDAEALRQQHPDAAVFNDPMPYINETEEIARQNAEEEIRRQVLDFIAWLAAVSAEG
ncbi:MAG: hypothetical protein FWH03_01735 [Firmicutes bacterium]|nr:hypothetical protein [Bacillota bacterium]